MVVTSLSSYKGVKTDSTKPILACQVEKGMRNMAPRRLSRENTALSDASHIGGSLFP
jgi:hypothetical protein